MGVQPVETEASSSITTTMADNSVCIGWETTECSLNSYIEGVLWGTGSPTSGLDLLVDAVTGKVLSLLSSHEFNPCSYIELVPVTTMADVKGSEQTML